MDVSNTFSVFIYAIQLMIVNGRLFPISCVRSSSSLTIGFSFDSKESVNQKGQ